ncbi:ATP-binding protein [[Clostridium] polysaccharolyticum]|uniref:ATPase family associated with various cellular activities (AAA) n=1 Tax=[Clostridium] polysaccharolyticum TaxID=29364 RepID=A0A1I0DKX4_9FIRM|nr:AAA family ATPase [[Clostridium] polysaccharolyticum]SET33132.1 ATPase family associated with various cellular activities (AAA) [[Clostridium] polysaccharolyticum]
MDIKRVKEELKHSLMAYLAKDEFGDYKIPAVRQRPVFLIGPPGIGKTAIMEQIAREMSIGLVSYTITHHTRQSAMGLPIIEKKWFGGQEFSVTAYTMSEILAAVYERIEEYGQKEGILFLDEMNCVSETLAPMMLQFLQCKTFGNQKLPEGWVIVTAGNPPEYNKSVRDFDIATLDRVKKIEVEQNYEVWREYAASKNLHPAILSYLDIKKEYFYVIETTVDGKQFVTARGWEDLSAIMYEYESMGIPIEESIVVQYLQHPAIAKDFSNYVMLFHKYQKEYQVEEILNGQFTEDVITLAKEGKFDERLSVLGLLLAKLREGFYEVYIQDSYVTRLYEYMKKLKIKSDCETVSMSVELGKMAEDQTLVLLKQKEGKQLDKDGLLIQNKVIKALEGIQKFLLETEDSFEAVKKGFAQHVQRREKCVENSGKQLKNAFGFILSAFGEGQELVIFLTELTSGFYSMQFISENGSDEYYQYNKSLLFREKEQELLREIEEAKTFF